MAWQDRFKDIQLEIQQTTRDMQFIYDTWHLRHQATQANFELIKTIQSQQAASFQVDNLVRLATQFVEAAENQAALLRSQAEYQNALSELLYRQGRIVEQSGLQVR